MANEDLIYRLTKAVYSRLGPGADEQTVEQLVTEVYREIEPFLSANGSSYPSLQSFPLSGGVGGYRWGVARKKKLLSSEAHGFRGGSC